MSAIKLIHCLLITIFVSQCLPALTGGYTEQRITPEIRITIKEVLAGIENTSNNPQFDKFKSARKAVVGYASQVVAGFNHSILFKLKDQKSYSYACIKVYQNLQNEYSLSSISFGLSYEDSKTLCYSNPNNRRASSAADSDL